MSRSIECINFLMCRTSLCSYVIYMNIDVIKHLLANENIFSISFFQCFYRKKISLFFVHSSKCATHTHTHTYCMCVYYTHTHTHIKIWTKPVKIIFKTTYCITKKYKKHTTLVFTLGTLHISDWYKEINSAMDIGKLQPD